MRMTPEQYERKLKNWIKTGPKAVKPALTRAAVEVIAFAQKKYLGAPKKMPRGVSGGFFGSHLAAPTGTLRKSLTKKIKVSSKGVSARIGSNLKYAAIHEYGGIIRGKGGGKLHFVIAGKHYMVDSVKIPARPYLRPSIQKNRPRILELVSDAFIGAYKRG